MARDLASALAQRQRTASSGYNVFDPTQNPDFNTGEDQAYRNLGDNSTNYIARQTQLLGRAGTDVNRTADQATASRATADASATGRPTYTPPPVYQPQTYQTPSYQAPSDFTYAAQYGGTRNPLQSDSDIAGRYSQFAGLTGANGLNNSGVNYQPEAVGDYGGAFNTYLQGAQSSFLKALGRQTSDLTESAAAKGRLQSGFYNKDVGTLDRDLAGQFSDQAQQAALQAAQLSLSGASGNADRALQAAQLRRSAANDAVGNNQNLLSLALQRGQQIDTSNSDAFENDRNAFNADRSFALGAYDDARDFGRSTFENDRDTARTDFTQDRDFGRNTYEDDRNFGYGAYRDSNADYQNTRDYNETRYQNDVGQSNNARDFYADYLSGAQDRRTAQDQYQESKPTGLERALGAVTGIAKTVLPFTGLGGAGAAGGAKPSLVGDVPDSEYLRRQRGLA